MKCVICSDECSGDLVQDGDIMCYDCYVTNAIGYRPPWLDVGHGEDTVSTKAVTHIKVSQDVYTVVSLCASCGTSLDSQNKDEIICSTCGMIQVNDFLQQYRLGERIKFTCSKCGGLGHSSKECRN